MSANTNTKATNGGHDGRHDHAIETETFVPLKRVMMGTNLISMTVTVIAALLAWRAGICQWDQSSVTSMAVTSIRALEEEEVPMCCPCIPTLPPSRFVDGNCNAEGVNQDFISYVMMEFEGRLSDVTAEEIQLLESSFQTSYNALGAPVCREILEADIQESVFRRRRHHRHLQFTLGGRNLTTVTMPFAFIYRITWRCNFCSPGAELFTNDGIRRKLQVPPPPGFSAPDDGVPVGAFEANYDAQIDVLVNTEQIDSIDRVVRVTELEEQEDCEGEASILGATVTVGFDNDGLESTTREELDLMNEAFIQTYNQLNALNDDTCDPLFREVGIAAGTIINESTLSFSVSFRCRGCSTADGMFSEAALGERNLNAWNNHDARSLQTVETDCLCAANARYLRAPTLGEFQGAFNQAIQILIFQDDLDLTGSVSEINGVASFSLAINKASYFQGESIITTYTGSESVSSLDRLLVFPANETNFFDGIPVLSEFASEDPRVLFPETGSFRLVLQSRTTEVIFAVSRPFEVFQSVATLTRDKGTYFVGEWADLEFSNPSQITSLDDLLVFPSNETDYTTDPVATYSAGRAPREARIDFPDTGAFKFVVRIRFTDVILAVSSPFVVIASGALLSTDKLSYFVGETADVTFSSPPQIDSVDELEVFRADEDDFSSDPIARDLSGSRQPMDFRITFPETGMFKFVMRLRGTDIILSVSAPFEVLPSTAELTTEKSSYMAGEEALVTFSNPEQLTSVDELEIFRADEDDLSSVPIARVLSGNSQPMNVRITFPETGMFKFAMRVRGTDIILSVSEPFEVLPSTAELTTDRSAYRVGEETLVTFGNFEQVATADGLLVFREDEEDFTSDPIASYFARPQQPMEARINFPETGPMKFVLRILNTDVFLAVSETIQVLPSAATLTLDDNVYNQGEEALLTFSSPGQVTSGDDMLVFRAQEADFTTTPVATYFSSAFSGPTNSSPFLIDFPEDGFFRFVLRLRGTTIILAISEPFEVL